uniref:ABC transporter permease n=1 Tax=Amycolatopsis balhimycina TaxID=208443 RepID=UPI0003A6DEB2
MRWAIEDGWTLTQRYLAQLARRPARLATVVAFPILMVLIFAYLLGGGMSVPGGGSYREFLMPGMFAMTMAFGLSGTMIAVLDDAVKGVTDRFRSLPIPARSWRPRRCRRGWEPWRSGTRCPPR